MINFRSYFSSSAGNLCTCSDGDTEIIIDLGVTFKRAQKALSFRMSGYSAAFGLHLHADHCRGIPEAIKKGMDCYVLPETADHLKISGRRVKIIEPFKQIKIGGFKILPFPLEHDVPNVGLLIESRRGGKLVYINDTNYCRYKFRGLNVIAVGCNYAADILMASSLPSAHKKRVMRSHFSLENVKEFLKANDLSRCREIHLLHLSAGNSDAGRFKREIEQLTGVPVKVCDE